MIVSRRSKKRKLHRKRATPDEAVVLNLSLFDEDDLFDVDDVSDTATTNAASAAHSTTTKSLYSPWDPEQASENHIVYEAYNAFSMLHGQFMTCRSRAYPFPIILVRNKSIGND